MPSKRKKIEILFQPMGVRLKTERGAPLLKSAQIAGIGLSAVCGGKGTCGTCKVRLPNNAAVNAPTSGELALLDSGEIRKGIRLACQCRADASLQAEVPADSITTSQRLLLEGAESVIEPDPVVTTVTASLSKPSQADLRSDWARLRGVLEKKQAKLFRGVAPEVLQTLSSAVRASSWRVGTLLREGVVVAVGPPDLKPLGLAVDLGTSKLAAYLIDLKRGRTVAQTGKLNPQIACGEDVMARIAYAMKSRDSLTTLQHSIVDAINEMIGILLQEAGESRAGLVDAVFAGNTAMHHLLLGLEVEQLGQAPYVPACAGPLDVPASSLGIAMAGGGRIHLMPNIAGFVGGDHVAMLLAAAMHRKKGRILGIDIGTNTEITLCAGGRMYCCSCASGPAFEGARIHDGMRAAPGAIDRVVIRGKKVFIQTIQGTPPMGICGSGALDAVAQLRAAGVLNEQGKMGDHPLVRKGEKGPEVVLVPRSQSAHGRGIVFRRRDVGEIQLAKSAIRSGIDVLLKRAGVQEKNLKKVLVAGAFGTYLDVNSALAVGMFPSLPAERFFQLGNAAGMGACRALLSKKERKAAARIADSVEYVELTGNPDFTQAFSRRMKLGE